MKLIKSFFMIFSLIVLKYNKFEKILFHLIIALVILFFMNFRKSLVSIALILSIDTYDYIHKPR